MKNKWIRKDLENYIPYHASPKPYQIKLDTNESPFGLTDKVKENMIQWLTNSENLNLYPDTDSTELRETLGIFWNVNPENVTCGVGSDQLIDYITKVFLGNHDVVVVPAPSFSMYGLSAVLNKGSVVEVPLESESGYGVDVEKMIAAAKNEKAKILFLCTPNNPTGSSMTQEQIIKILENVDCPVVVDEAYGEFSEKTMIPFINTYENLIVLRTFSKAYGLAGARVGYAVANESLIEAINIAKSPFNLPTLSQMIAVEVLKESQVYKERAVYLIERRKSLLQMLQEIPWMKVYPSDANFIFIECRKGIAKALESKGILVRYFPKPNEDESEKIRITVGSTEQNNKVMAIIKEL